ncbi:glutathione S-transferase family protein [Variovorax rhizosphaerae]|uniref:Glutathione S-transferase family protein n=1 Tax=Variovorax rhizosphaerae TaxID=1836200 RepID=A0ABU8WRF4_9BURK
MDYALYGHPESGHSYKVKLALEVAGIPHDYEVVDISGPHLERPEPFRSLARYGEVPVLVYRQQAYVQSNAILLLLAAQTHRFGGEDTVRLARAQEWLFWEANRLGLSLAHLRFARRFDALSYPEGSLVWFERRYEHDIRRLEQEFSDGRRFILDDAPSIADFSLCGYLYWADQAQVEVPPGVAAWLERISQLPGWGPPDTLLADREAVAHV